LQLITAIRIENYKGIRRSPRLELESFHVLVGPNGSDGPLHAVESRVPEFRDLTFGRNGGRIKLDLWLRLPVHSTDSWELLHYRLVVGEDERLGVAVKEELLTLDHEDGSPDQQRILGKTKTGNDFYRREIGSYTDSFQFGLSRLALSLTPPDIHRYPTGNAVKAFLSQGIRYIHLDSAAMRQPAAATRPTELDLDGTNLARVVGSLIRNGGTGARHKELTLIDRWTDHLRYALEDLESIGWAARQADNAEYLILKFAGGLECPSWLLSDGTLRMLALTLPAFLPGSPGVYMVEEPENGVHPCALEIIVRALESIPQAQVFVATHSPLVVQQVGVKPLLCFTRSPVTGVHIIHGPAHHALRDWKGSPDLASIFSSRVLG
jgi:predicted ATPase